MMMVQDSPPDRPELSAESVAVLKSALETYLADQSQLGSIQPALRRVAAEARDRKIHAEQLLLILKDIWFGLPQIRSTPEGEPQRQTLQRIVTLCIREYYAS